jgi:integrase
MASTFTKTTKTGTTTTYTAFEVLHAPKGMYKLDGVESVYIDVRNPTSASWMYVYHFETKRFELGLGSATKRVLKPAEWMGEPKRLAATYAGMLANGQNPKQFERSNKTFGEMLEEQIALEQRSKPTWKEATTWRAYGRNYFPGLMNMRPCYITRHLVAAQLAKGWDSNATTAGRARGVIELVMNRCRDLELCAFDINPADSGLIVSIMGSRLSTEQDPHVSVPYADMPALAARILTPKTGHWYEMGNARKALMVAAAIPNRSAEVFKMKRSNVNLTTGRWETPAEDNKKGNEQVNDLPWQVVAILRSIPEVAGNDYFFTGKDGVGHISAGRMREILQDEMKVTVEGQKATVHGFRSSMITFAGNRLGLDRDMMKGILSHRPQAGKKKKEALDHYFLPETVEKRAKALQAWADYIFPDSFMGNVTQLKEAA